VHYQVTTLGKLFTPICLCRLKWSSGWRWLTTFRLQFNSRFWSFASNLVANLLCKHKRQEGPPRVRVITAKMEMVKEAGAVSPPTCRRPLRNYMSALLKTVTWQCTCQIQKHPRWWKIISKEELELQHERLKLVVAAAIISIDDGMAAQQYNRRI